ncbi:etoposide-induced protein 2.4-domain-containing protein [Panaeolus papilionaceus]|nr:etoposide-induced protein 2.4-domain-containing protein [Panaeolus papilionaceus]
MASSKSYPIIQDSPPLPPNYRYPHIPNSTSAPALRPNQQQTRTSSRASYPNFLSVQDSALLQLKWAFKGLVDAFRWNVLITTVMSDAEIRAHVYKSLLLNSLSLVSIYIFDWLLHPLVQGQERWLHRNIGRFYQVLWLLPLVGASLYLNGTWSSTIAKRIYLLQHGGRPAAPQAVSYTGILNSLATSAYRVIMVCTSFMVWYALSMIPFVGHPLGFLFFCWVDAYYCFEHLWIARGYSLSRRIRHLEERWAYFLAFGLPSTAVCVWSSTLANAALFALVYPWFIIMAMHAQPVPEDPYNPMPPQIPGPQDCAIHHPSPFIPIRLPIFALVLTINDAVVRVLNFVGGRRVVRHHATPSFGSKVGGIAGVPGRRRANSVEADNVEGGMGYSDNVELADVRDKTRARGHHLQHPGGASVPTSGPVGGPVKSPMAGRINLGPRKKAD